MQTEPPHHPILEHPWTYRVVGLRFECSPGGFDASYLELDFLRDGTLRTLRFGKPTQLRIEPSFPNAPGLAIYDIRDRGLEARIEVSSFEQDGSIRFYAATVEEVTS